MGQSIAPEARDEVDTPFNDLDSTGASYCDQ